MTLFILILLFLFIAYPLFFIKGTKKAKQEIGQKGKRIYTFFISFILVVVSGLRDFSIGIDTYAYSYRFDTVKYLNFQQIFKDVEIEHGYRLFEYLVGRIFGEFQVLLVIVAVLYIGIVSYNIYKYSLNPILSYILFIGFGFYTFSMSAVRQTIAISIILIAFQYIPQKKLSKFILLVVLASTFHISALIYLPSYWFNKIKLNRKSITFFIVIALVFIIFKDEIRSLAMYYSGKQFESMETGGNKFYLLMIFSLMLGLLYKRKFLIKDEINKYLFFMIVAATILIPITQFHPAVSRLYFYYSIMLIIYIPNILAVINDRAIRFIGVLGYSITLLLIFFTNTISSSKLDSYIFFWQ